MLRAALLLILLFSFSSGANKVVFCIDNTDYVWKRIQLQQLGDRFAQIKQIDFSYKNGKGDIAKQVDDIEKSLDQGADALIISPVNAAITAPVIEKAYDAGVKIIYAIRAADTDRFHTYIHPDDYQIAAEAARYILQQLKNPKAVMIQGRLGANTVKKRKEGFVHEFQKHGSAEITAVKTGNYTPDGALKAMDSIIEEGIEFNAVYTHNDAMQQGVRIALQKHGIDFKDVVLVGIDYIKEARDAIKAGQMDATFTYPTCADDIVQATSALLAGKEVKKDITVASQRITTENVDTIKPLF
ncbi:MAG: substrate-binding domain-containing protein [Campylobacterota bacterium]